MIARCIDGGAEVGRLDEGILKIWDLEQDA